MVGISKEQRAALAEVRARFEPQPMNDEQVSLVESLSKQFVKLAGELQRLLPDGRNKSLALTSLEDASMRATRAIAKDTVEDEADVEAEDVAEVEAPKPRGRRAAKAAASAAPAKRVPRRRRAAAAPAEEAEDGAEVDPAA